MAVEGISSSTNLSEGDGDDDDGGGDSAPEQASCGTVVDGRTEKATHADLTRRRPAEGTPAPVTKHELRYHVHKKTT